MGIHLVLLAAEKACGKPARWAMWHLGLALLLRACVLQVMSHMSVARELLAWESDIGWAQAKWGVGALAPKPMKGMVRGGMRDFPSIGCTLILSVVTTEPAPHLPAGMHCSTQNSTKSTTRSTPHLGCSRPLHRHGSGADNGQRHAGRRCRCTAVCNSSTP